MTEEKKLIHMDEVVEKVLLRKGTSLHDIKYLKENKIESSIMSLNDSINIIVDEVVAAVEDAGFQCKVKSLQILK